MPGFRQNKAQAAATSQTLRLVHGHMIVNTRPTTSPDAALLGTGTMTMSSAALRSTSPTRGVDASGYYDLGGRYSIRSQSRDRTAKARALVAVARATRSDRSPRVFRCTICRMGRSRSCPTS